MSESLFSAGSCGGLVTKLYLALWIPRTVACQAPLSMDFPGKNTRVGCCFLLQEIFLTQDQIWVSCIADGTEPPGKTPSLCNYLNKTLGLLLRQWFSTKGNFTAPLPLVPSQPPPPGIFGNVWKHFWMSQLRVLLRGQECF